MISKTAVVTGAGSGVGRAVATALARLEWRVALIGRRREALDETARLAGADPERLLVCTCDIRDPNNVDESARRILSAFGNVQVLVNSAGVNVARRALADVSPEDYREIVDTNLNGAFSCVQAFLPGMRERGSGTIVNIVSDAGLLANAKAGAAYVASKFGLTGLTQSINAEEHGHGIRACAVCPGDIDTPLLEKRPTPPDREARARMLQPEDVAACVLLCIDLPPRAIVEQILVRPR